MSLKSKLFTAFMVIVNSSVFAAKYYVATTGVNSNPGTIDQPFLTIQRAQEAVAAGDTVYIRGGTYTMTESQIAKTDATWAYVTYLDKSGTSGKRINYWAYPGERPIFDFQNIKPALRINAFQVNGSWIHLKGFEVVGVQVTITTHTQSECFENQGSNNIYEQLSMHDGQAIGFYLTRGSNNLILNCDAYRNWDYTSENKLGGNVDGFGNHPVSASHTNNIYRGCRAWFNSDDGYDCISAHTPTIFENCWAFYNGYSSSFGSLGDGNGFKAGGYGTTAFDRLPVTPPRNIIKFCLAVRNKSNGFYSNHHLSGSDWLNNSAYYNATNYNMLNRKAKTEADYLTDVSGYGHYMKNNLGFGARSTELSNLDQANSNAGNNYFNLPVAVSAADFESLDMALLTEARQADGSLPDIGLMKLVSNSDLIDAGTDITYPFYGSKPDLGYREFGLSYLPVKLINFSVKAINNRPVLSWITAYEINSDHFEVERSNNGKLFFTIGIQKGATNSAAMNKYAFTDNSASGTDLYYRLKQVDQDGKFSYSKVIIFNDAVSSAYSLYPNPVSTSINVNIPPSASAYHILNIYDLSGKKLRSFNLNCGFNFIQNLEDLGAGVYVVEIRNENQVIKAGKILKEN